MSITKKAHIKQILITALEDSIATDNKVVHITHIDQFLALKGTRGYSYMDCDLVWEAQDELKEEWVEAQSINTFKFYYDEFVELSGRSDIYSTSLHTQWVCEDNSYKVKYAWGQWGIYVGNSLYPMETFVPEPIEMDEVIFPSSCYNCYYFSDPLHPGDIHCSVNPSYIEEDEYGCSDYRAK